MTQNVFQTIPTSRSVTIYELVANSEENVFSRLQNVVNDPENHCYRNKFYVELPILSETPESYIYTEEDKTYIIKAATPQELYQQDNVFFLKIEIANKYVVKIVDKSFITVRLDPNYLAVIEKDERYFLAINSEDNLTNQFINHILFPNPNFECRSISVIDEQFDQILHNVNGRLADDSVKDEVTRLERRSFHLSSGLEPNDPERTRLQEYGPEVGMKIVTEAPLFSQRRSRFTFEIYTPNYSRKVPSLKVRAWYISFEDLISNLIVPYIISVF